MTDRFHGSAHPHQLLEGAPRDDFATTRSLPYRGCTHLAPRTGIARTAPTWILRAAGHLNRASITAIRLDLGDTPWAGVPCWTGGPKQWANQTVPAAYKARYATHVRPVMPGNPISLKALVRVAEARAAYADYRTGRNCRPTNERLSADTGYSVRTVQRASTALRLLGVSTEILRGRQRTYNERMASWRVGDRGRGWASLWVLHDSRFRQLSPHLAGSHFKQEIPPVCKKLTTRTRRSRDGRSAATRHTGIDPGRLLAQRWILDSHSPTWARRYRTSTPWARVLAGAAQHGWTPRDINQLISDYIGAGHWVPDTPHKPAGLLGAMLTWHSNLQERPAALDEAREAEQLAAHRARIREQLAQREVSQLARAAGQAALNGPGHTAARQALSEALARRRRTRYPDEAAQ
ncbi:hypothetical protein MSIMFB_04427 [Mycobacterium simulans]|uniref:Helix-turn-helix domain-containing protein n=1 Tax=Mycobacterium simulans TaxID=627089 RepID=A0A7Z7INM5_9MYCO|nr:helix-turn-helix domain-containing protein [Mycobacterium simulans]SOJ56949.1 hypothetical protein MSIMFB_04427 [Mycobacterium simulans]